MNQAIFKPNFLPYDIQYFSNLVNFSHLPAYENETGCSETSTYELKRRLITQKNGYNLQNAAKFWNEK